MTDDLEEIKERLGQLEAYVNLLESRLDMDEGLMKFYTVSGEPTVWLGAENAPSGAVDAEDAGPGWQNLPSDRLDYLLRSVVTQQSMHSTNLRNSARNIRQLRLSMENATRSLI